MSKMNQGDVVHVEAIVEIDFGDEVSLIVRSAAGVEPRARVKKTAIKHHEIGPIKAGDKVAKGTGKTRKEGVVKHRDGDNAWVAFGDAQSIEAVSGLSRV